MTLACMQSTLLLANDLPKPHLAPRPLCLIAKNHLQMAREGFAEQPHSLLKLCKPGLVLLAAAVRQSVSVVQPTGHVDVETRIVGQVARCLLPSIAASHASASAVCRLLCAFCMNYSSSSNFARAPRCCIRTLLETALKICAFGT